MKQDALDKTAEEYEAQRRGNEGIYTIADVEIEEKEKCKICQLRGCSLHVEDGKRYCSKRHYHSSRTSSEDGQEGDRRSRGGERGRREM